MFFVPPRNCCWAITELINNWASILIITKKESWNTVCLVSSFVHLVSSRNSNHFNSFSRKLFWELPSPPRPICHVTGSLLGLNLSSTSYSYFYAWCFFHHCEPRVKFLWLHTLYFRYVRWHLPDSLLPPLAFLKLTKQQPKSIAKTISSLIYQNNLTKRHSC